MSIKFNIEKKRTQWIFIMVMLSILWFILSNTLQDFKFLIWISIMVNVIAFLCLKKVFGALSDLFVIFYIIFFLFNFGQLVLIGVSYPIDQLDGMRWNNISDIYKLKMLSFVTISQMMLCIGGILSKNPSKNHNNYTIILNSVSANYYTHLKRIGLILMIFSVPIDLYIQIARSVSYWIFGYATEVYNPTSTIFSISLFCIPGCFIATLGNQKKINLINRNWPLLYLLLRSGLMLIGGKRGQSMGVLVAVLWFFLKTNKDIIGSNRKKTNGFYIAMLLYAGMTVLVTVKDIRTLPNKTVGLVLGVFLKELLSGSVISSVLNELGFSIRPLYETMRLMDLGVFHHTLGLTMIASIIMIVPSFLRFGLYEKFVGLGWLGIEDELSHYLVGEINLNYGIGYSLNAEMFYNFGMFGCLASILVGIILAKLLSDDNVEKDIIKIALMPTLLALLVISIRGTMQVFYKYIFYYYFLLLLLNSRFKWKLK